MNVNENNIRANLPDVLVGYHNIGITVQKAQKTIAPRHHDLTYTSRTLIKFQITHPSQFLTILDIDDVLTF